MSTTRALHVTFKLDTSPMVRALRKFATLFRTVSADLASQRTGYPILRELDEIEWPFGDRRSYYGDHPYVRAFERKPLFSTSQLIGGAARVLYAPVPDVPTRIEDIVGWTDLGMTRGPVIR